MGNESEGIRKCKSVVTWSRQTAQLSPTQSSAPQNCEQGRSYFEPQSLGLIYEVATALEAPLDRHL